MDKFSRSATSAAAHRKSVSPVRHGVLVRACLLLTRVIGALVLLAGTPQPRTHAAEGTATGVAGDGRAYGVFGQRSNDAAASLGAEFQVNTYTGNDQRAPALAVFPEGDFIAVWESRLQDGAGFGIYGQRFDPDGAPLGSEFLVETVTSGAQRRPDVAINEQGDVVIVWDSVAPISGGTDVIARSFDRDGNPQGPELRVNALAANTQRLPRIAGAGDGFVVVWETAAEDEDVRGISARRLDSQGQPLGSEFAVNSYTDGGQRRPLVAADAAGNFVVVWDNVNQDGAGRGVLGQLFDSGGSPLGSEFVVNTYTTGNQIAPVAVGDPSGGFIVAWQSANQDGSGTGVFGRRYDTGAVALGTEFQINTFTTSNQSAPELAMLGSGGFVVVWASFGQDGESDGVFAQRYDVSMSPLGSEYRVSTTTIGEQSAPTVAADGDRVVVLWHGRAHCSGDCNDNGEVGINELVRGVNIVLGTQDAMGCSAIDTDGNQTVTVAELVRAVNSALNGCPA